MRQPVAGREVAQAPHVGRVAGTDDPHPGAEADQHGPADQVGLENQVTEHRVLGQQVAHPAHRHGQHLAWLGDHGRVQRRLPGQQAELAQEAAGTMDGDQLLVRARERLDDSDLAGQDDEEIVPFVTVAEQHLSGLRAAPRAMSVEHADLLFTQARVGPDGVGSLFQRKSVAGGDPRGGGLGELRHMPHRSSTSASPRPARRTAPPGARS